MDALAIALFGGFVVEVQGEPITAFESNKVRALLAYLTVEASDGRTRPHQRAALAGLLWPDYPEEMARTNLRHVLRQLRQTLPEPAGAAPLLLTTQQTIQINPACPYTLDVAQFTHLLAEARRCAHRDLAACPACLARYHEAAQLYRGDFLAGLSLYDSEPFDEWLVIQREGYHRQALELFFTLAAYHEAQGQFEQAGQYARRQLQLEPWREEAHRQLMRVLVASGQRAAALAQYIQCRKTLADELGVEPDAETVALYEAIRAGQLDKMTRRQEDKMTSASEHPVIRSSSHPVILSPLQDWDEAPATPYFYGRETEVDALKRWLLGERCRLIIVLAMGGMGKTTLAAKAMRLWADEFEFVWWRSLLNAPPLAELLPNALRFLARQQLDQLPTTVSDQLTLLISYLRQHRCLLVFDNIESILEAGQAGHYRAGYEGYGQLIDRVVQSDHQSCLLLTSRECPHGVEQFEEDFPWVRSLTLEGLGVVAGHALLRTRGVADETKLVNELVQRYSGNPLALKLVARTIQDLFDGDIAAFLSDDAPIFDDIRAVLDQQFRRLTPLEREILIWLAIEREGISLQTLTQTLVQPPTRRDLLEAVRALQHRSLIEKTESGFTLQNVVTEYVTDYIIEQICTEIKEGKPAVQLTLPTSAIRQFLLHRHALLKAHSKEYIRQSQRRLLLEPVSRHLEATLGRAGVQSRLQTLLDQIRAQAPCLPSYAGNNILNLLLQLKVDLQGWNFSRLAVWQAALQNMDLQGIDFTEADFSGSSFTETFGVIYTVAYSPDGQWIAAGTLDGEVWLWRAVDNQPLRVIRGHTGSVRALTFHPDGKTLASGGDDHTVRIWETASGRALHTLLGHNGWVRAVTFSPDGSLLVSGSMDGTLCLWEPVDGALQQILHEHTDAVWAVAFHPRPAAQPWFASCSADYTIRLWDLPRRQVRCILTGHTDEVRCLAFSPDGKQLASGGLNKGLCLWDIDDATERYTLRQMVEGDKSGVRCLSFSPDGAILASGGADYSLRLWDPQSLQVRQTLYGHEKGINALAYAPDGKTLVSGSDDRSIRIWNPASGQRRDTLHGHTGWVRVVAFRPQSAQAASAAPPIVASGSDDAVVRLWDADSGVRLHALRKHHHWIWSMAFSADGDLLATGGADHMLCIWDVKEPLQGARLRHSLPQHTNTVRSLAFSPRGDLLASGDGDFMIHLWDPVGGQLLQRLEGHRGWVNALVFSADGAILASASTDQSIRLWLVDRAQRANPAWGKPLHILRGKMGGLVTMLFSPDGSRLASAGSDSAVYLWDLQALRPDGGGQSPSLQQLQGHQKAITALAYSPDGQFLASASSDQTVRLWDGQSGQALAVLAGHTAWVSAVAFAPTIDQQAGHASQLLASAGADQTIRLWAMGGPTGSPQLRHVLHGHDHWIWAIAFSPDGELLASGSVDKTIKVWSTRTGACQLTLRPRGPYTGMNISGATGISEAQRSALKALGAVEG